MAHGVALGRQPGRQAGRYVSLFVSAVKGQQAAPAEELSMSSLLSKETTHRVLFFLFLFLFVFSFCLGFCHNKTSFHWAGDPRSQEHRPRRRCEAGPAAPKPMAPGNGARRAAIYYKQQVKCFCKQVKFLCRQVKLLTCLHKKKAHDAIFFLV